MQIGSLLTAGLCLALVLGLILFAGRVARRVGLPDRLGLGIGRTAGGRLAAVQVLALDGKRRLHLLRCDGRHLLLLTGGGQDLLVGWVDPSPADLQARAGAEPPA